jgi:hypothetical protein
MSRRLWGKDDEERSAVALKAQSAYAAARQAMEKITGVEVLVASLREELVSSREETGRLLARVRALEAVDTMPKKMPRIPPRRVA